MSAKGDLKGKRGMRSPYRPPSLVRRCNMPMFERATGVTISDGKFNDVSGDMTINDSSSHTTNHGSFNTTNETYNSGNNNFTRNDFSRSKVS